MACGRHGDQIVFQFSKEAHDTIKDIADGAIPLMPSISLDDFGLSGRNVEDSSHHRYCRCGRTFIDCSAEYYTSCF